jgi:hypothetical protein
MLSWLGLSAADRRTRPEREAIALAAALDPIAMEDFIHRTRLTEHQR